MEYKTGDSVYLLPESISFNIKPKPPPKKIAAKKDLVRLTANSVSYF